MKYAVDLDGTLADTVGAVLEYYNEKNDTHYTRADVARWDFWNAFEELQVLPEPKRRDRILRMMDAVWLLNRVRPMPHAAEFMALLKHHGRVDVVTGRGQGTSTETIEAWLKANGIQYDTLLRVRGSKSKVYYSYDVYVDDDPRLAEEIALKWPQKQVFLVDAPWNRDVPDSERVTRIDDLTKAVPSTGGTQARLFRHPHGPVPVHQYRRRRRAVLLETL